MVGTVYTVKWRPFGIFLYMPRHSVLASCLLPPWVLVKQRSSSDHAIADMVTLN